MASGLYSVAAPSLWKVLPLDIRASSNVNIFKAKLKTYLFKYAYNLQLFWLEFLLATVYNLPFYLMLFLCIYIYFSVYLVKLLEQRCISAI